MWAVVVSTSQSYCDDKQFFCKNRMLSCHLPPDEGQNTPEITDAEKLGPN